MDTPTNQYPTDWPKGCPSSDAEAASGLYFRVGRHNPPTAADFQSQAELGRAVSGDECLRVGLSMLRSLTDAEHLIRLNRKLGTEIYRGELITSHGHSKLTGSHRSPSHTTWWPFAGIDRAAPFSMVEA